MTFRNLIGDPTKLKRQGYEPDLHGARMGPTKLEDFDATHVLGRGNHAMVLQGRQISTGKVCALKVMQKEAIVAKGEVPHVLEEAALLKQINHLCITKLFGTIVTPGCLILVMEPCPVGDLFDLLQMSESQFDVPRARILSAQVCKGTY